MEFTILFNCYEEQSKSPGETRDIVFFFTADPEIAIDVGNWCEIAKDNERYIGRDFEVWAKMTCI